MPAAVASPVVSVSRQTSGRVRRRVARQPREALAVERDLDRRRDAGARAAPSGPSATSAPSAAASRAASAGLRRPANGARAGSWSGPIGRRRAARERRPQVREPPLPGDDRPERRLDRHATATASAAATAARGPVAAGAEAGEQAQRERLAVDLGLEARPGAGRDSRPRTGTPG